MGAAKVLKQQTNMVLLKSKQVSKSSNFWTNLLSVLFAYLAYLGIEVDPEIPGQIVDNVNNKNFIGVVMILLNFINPIIHIFDPQKLKEKFWEFLKSTNFYTNVLTLLAGILITAGVVLPESFVGDLVNAIEGGEFKAIAVAIVVNILNPLYHIWFRKD